MVKYAGLLLGVCLLTNGLVRATSSEIAEAPIKAIKIEEVSIEPVASESSNASCPHSFMDKCILAAKGVSAGAVSLLCGFCAACVITHFNPIAQSTLRKSFRTAIALSGTPFLIIASLDAYKYSLDSLRTVFRAQNE